MEGRIIVFAHFRKKYRMKIKMNSDHNSASTLNISPNTLRKIFFHLRNLCLAFSGNFTPPLKEKQTHLPQRNKMVGLKVLALIYSDPRLQNTAKSSAMRGAPEKGALLSSFPSLSGVCVHNPKFTGHKYIRQPLNNRLSLKLQENQILKVSLAHHNYLL